MENRVPGGDANPYLAFAATIAAGLYGIEHRLEPPPMLQADAYHAAGLPRIPSSLPEAIACLETSTVAREAFGDVVVDHYLNAARLEQAAFERAVTCWELDRYFERIQAHRIGVVAQGQPEVVRHSADGPRVRRRRRPRRRHRRVGRAAQLTSLAVDPTPQGA